MGERTDLRRRHTRQLAALVTATVCTLVVTLSPALASAGSAPDGSAEGSTPEPLAHYRIFSSDGRDMGVALRNLVEMNAMPSVETGDVPTTHPPATDAQACPRSRCRDYRLNIPADVHVTRPIVRVLLPVGYAKHPHRRYPVVYLYNGAKSPYYRWTQATMLTKLSRKIPAIFVMPEGGYGHNAGMFADWKDGSFDWETFHVDHVIPWVDRKFRAMPRVRAAAGVSMGSLGVLDYATRHPGLFQAVLSISGIVDTTSIIRGALPQSVLKVLGYDETDLNRVWGNPVLDRATWSAHNPVEQVSKLRGTKLFIASGTGSNHYNPADEVHSGSIEQSIWNSHRLFFAALTQAGVPYTARISLGGFHDWPSFHEPIKWGLPLIVEAARR